MLVLEGKAISKHINLWPLQPQVLARVDFV